MLFKFIWCLLFSMLTLGMADPKQLPKKKPIKPNLPRWMDSDQTNAREATDFSHDMFHTSVQLYEQIERIGKLGGDVRVRNLTNKLTVMERGIKLITIQAPPKKKAEAKSTVFVVAGVHGRDWYSTAAAMFLIHELTVNSGENKKAIEQYNWWIVPLLNPDGYNLSMSNCFRGFEVRNWMKNCEQRYTFLSDIVGPQATATGPPLKFNMTIPQLDHCGGIDPEKNFEYQWINYNYKNLTNATMCDPNYPDQRRHSQVETSGLSDLLGDENEAGITLFINIREGASAIAYPYCYTKRQPSFMKDAEKLTKKAAGEGKYAYGQSSKLLPMHAGAIEDYVEAHFGVRNSISLFIKEHTMSKSKTRGGKIRTRSRRAFKTIMSLAKHHNTYRGPAVDQGMLMRLGGEGRGRSAFMRRGGFLPPGGLATRSASTTNRAAVAAAAASTFAITLVPLLYRWTLSCAFI